MTVQKDVIVLYGDTILNVDINDLISHHRKSSKEITMTVWPLKLDYGLVEIAENGTVESFAEKPTLDKWINIGFFYINMGYRDFVFSHNSFSLSSLTLQIWSLITYLDTRDYTSLLTL